MPVCSQKSIFVFSLTDTSLISAGRIATLSACVHCPPLYVVQTYILVPLYFCILYRFVILGGGQRQLVLHSVTKTLIAAFRRGQLDRSCRSAEQSTPSFENEFPCLDPNTS